MKTVTETFRINICKFNKVNKIFKLYQSKKPTNEINYIFNSFF